MPRFITSLTIGAAARGAQAYEIEAEIGYSVSPGDTSNWGQPGEGESVEIVSVVVLEEDERFHASWLVPILEDDSEIIAQCLADWQDACGQGDAFDEEQG